MPRHAFIDESGRGSRYFLCAIVIHDVDVVRTRSQMRALCLAGQRRWHFTQERNSRRRQILDAIVDSRDFTGRVIHGKGDDAILRPRLLRAMATWLLTQDVRRLTIESRQGRDRGDRQTLIESLRGVRRPFTYDHRAPHEEPLLWPADAIAWSASAGGRWRERISSMISVDELATGCR